MCPVCLATIGLLVAGAASMGGLAAIAVKAALKKAGARGIVRNLSEGRNSDVSEHNQQPENSVA